jgi:hypothetical protein
MSDTWNGNLGNQIPTGNAVRDGATATGLYTVDVTIPSGMNKECFTKDNWTTYTDVPTANYPLGSMSNNECPSQDEVLSVF